MNIGLVLTSFTWPGSPANIGAKLTEIGQAADEAGFASLWVMDHFSRLRLWARPKNRCWKATAS